MEGTSPVEIARELGIKRNAVDAILHRAKRGLATRLGPRSSWGLVALPFIRLRDGVRHGFRFASSFVPAASPGVEAGFAIATVAIATALTFAMPVSTGPSDVSTRDDVGGPVVTRTHAPSKVPVTRVAKEPVAGVVVQPPGNVGTRYDVGSAGGEIKNPATGKKDDAGLDLWYDFDEKDPSPIDPVLRDAGESLMEVAQ
jgi:hypothetical protein